MQSRLPHRYSFQYKYEGRIIKKHPYPCDGWNKILQPIHSMKLDPTTLGKFQHWRWIFSWSTRWSNNCYISFKILNIFFQFDALLLKGLFNMPNLPIVMTSLLLFILSRVWWISDIQFSFLVETFLSGYNNINTSSIIIYVLTLTFE